MVNCSMFDVSPPTTSLNKVKADQSLAPSLAQSQEFTKALNLYGQNPIILDVPESLVLLRRRFFNSIHVGMVNRAYITDLRAVALELRSHGLKRTPLLISPETPQPELANQGALPLMTPAKVAKLNLTDSIDGLRAGLHQKWRNRLKYGESQGLRITLQNMPLDPNHWLLRADSALQKQRGYRSWPVALTLAYCAANAGRAKLFQAFDNKTPVAAILILTHGDIATYHIAHSTERGKKLCAHNLLMWSVITWLAAQKITMLDLGLINTEDAAGLARFKLGTGAVLSKLGGTWLYLPSFRRNLRLFTQLDQKKMRI